MRLLLIEDDAALRLGLARQLEADGYRVDQSKDGEDGLFPAREDQVERAIVDPGRPKLRANAKYCIRLDSIDVKYATSKKLPVLFTTGVNEPTVAEHAYGLMIAVSKNFWFHLKSTKAGKWGRQTGHELFGKTLGVPVDRAGRVMTSLAVWWRLRGHVAVRVIRHHRGESRRAAGPCLRAARR